VWRKAFDEPAGSDADAAAIAVELTALVAEETQLRTVSVKDLRNGMIGYGDAGDLEAHHVRFLRVEESAGEGDVQWRLEFEPHLDRGGQRVRELELRAAELEKFLENNPMTVLSGPEAAWGAEHFNYREEPPRKTRRWPFSLIHRS
jgi:hypothetical protein